MKNKLLSLLLVTVLCFGVVLTSPIYTSDSVAEAASYTLTKPTIKAVKNVNDSYLKITWNDTKDAEKYYVYRATSKNGKYKKIATTTKTFYKDKKVNNNKRYYYKIRGINDDEKSKLSGYKSGKITFEGKLSLSDDYFEMGLGEVVPVYVSSHGCDDEIIAYYDSDWLEVEWGTEGDMDVLYIYAENESLKPINTSVDLKFKEHERLYCKTIDITISEQIYIANYTTFPEVPDFGAFAGARISYSQVNGNSTNYFYDYSAIKAAGFLPENVIAGYKTLLEGRGYKPTFSQLNQYGGYYSEYTNGSTTVGIFDVPTGAYPAIGIGITRI